MEVQLAKALEFSRNGEKSGISGSLAESLDVGILVFNINIELLECNEVAKFALTPHLGPLDRVNWKEALVPFDIQEIQNNPLSESASLQLKIQGGKSIQVRGVFRPLQHEQLNDGVCFIFHSLALKSQVDESLILSEIGDAVVSWDISENINYWNKSAERLYGYSECEALGNKIEALLKIRWLDPEQHFSTNDSLEDNWRGIQIHSKKDGHFIYVDVSCSILRAGNGEKIGVVATYRDISERRKWRQALVDSERRFRNICDLVPFGIPTMLPDGQFIYVNSQMCQMLGYTEREFRSLKMDDVIHPDDLSDVIQLFQKLRNGDGEVGHHEQRYLRKNGDVMWCSTFLAAVRGASGEFEYAVAIVQDISEHKQVDEVLKQTQETLKGLFRASPLAIMGLDRQGIVTSWNEAAEKMFGWTEKEAIGRRIPIVPPERQREGFAIRRQIMEDEYVTTLELVRQKKDGSKIDISVFAVPVHDGRGDVVGITAFISDITPRKRAEVELRKARIDAEAANRAKSDFLANMSHEIRTPLGAILGFSEVLLKSGGLNNNQRSWARTILRNGQHLHMLVEDILDLSK